MDGKLDALGDALGASLNGRKLYRVCCERTEDRERARTGTLDDPWKARKSAYVAGHSIESASMKAVQFFNRKNNANDYEVREVAVYAEAAGEGDIFIE